MIHGADAVRAGAPLPGLTTLLMYCDVNDVLRAQDALQKPHPRVGDDLLLDDSRIVCAQANVVLVLPRIAAMTGGADLRVDRAAVGDVGGFGTRAEETGKREQEQAKAKNHCCVLSNLAW